MKTLLHVIINGFIGALAVLLSFSLHLPAWIVFLAWVSYYVLAKNPLAAGLLYVQMLLGIGLGAFLQLGGGYVNELMGMDGSAGHFGPSPVVVFFVIGGLSLVTHLKVLNNLPAYFLGMIVFFGAHRPISSTLLLELGIPMLVGLVFAWVNSTLNDRATRTLNYGDQ